jgi:transcriptional/translational regulatory protein YebC/TACO1
MAGHSKYANRKHIKAEKNRERDATNKKIRQKLRTAIQGLLLLHFFNSRQYNVIA